MFWKCAGMLSVLKPIIFILFYVKRVKKWVKAFVIDTSLSICKKNRKTLSNAPKFYCCQLSI